MAAKKKAALGGAAGAKKAKTHINHKSMPAKSQVLKKRPSDYIDAQFEVVEDGQQQDNQAIKGSPLAGAVKSANKQTTEWSGFEGTEEEAEAYKKAAAGDGNGRKVPAEQSDEEWRVTEAGLEKEIEDRKKNSDFLKKVYKSLEGLSAEQYKNARDNIADKFKITVEYLDSIYKGMESESKNGKRRGTSQKDKIVELVLNSGAELWHYHDEPYATFKIADHVESTRTRERRFKRYVSMLFYRATRQAPSSQAMQDALSVIEGRALFDGVEHPVNIRVAGDGINDIVIDLGDKGWNGVRITKEGWSIIRLQDLEERFIRPQGMTALPYPEKGGNFDTLRGLINIEDDDDFSLLKAFIIGCYRPVPPGRPISRPLLAVYGEQGSAKSSLCNLVKKLVDPSLPLSRSAPREERDLAIAARNSWVIAYDNLSYIQDWLSDALSRLSTGAGFATRTLFENDTESIFSAQRSIIINGIEEVARRPDLLDRAIPITTPEIPPEKRLIEDEYWQCVETALPGIMAAIFDALSATLRAYPVEIDRLPRMADFCTWSVSTEVGMGWEPLFLKAYANNRQQANIMALEGNHIAEELQRASFPETWTGTAAELLEELNINVSETVKKLKEWPKSARGVSGQLRRIMPNLRKIGINVIFNRNGQSRTVQIVRDSTVTTVTTVTKTGKNDGHDANDGQIPIVSTRTDSEQGVTV